MEIRSSKLTKLVLCASFALFAISTVQARIIPPTAELNRLHDVLTAPQAPIHLPNLAPSLVPDQLPDVVDSTAATTFFTLNEVKLEGATLYDPELFLRIFAHSTGQKISVQQLYALVNEITKIYRNDGYILSRALLPPQEIQDGTVHINIIEGGISEVELTGAHKDSRLLKKHANRIVGTILHNATLERALLLMNDISGVLASSTLEPGTEPNTSKLVIHTADDKISGSNAISNWTTRFFGPIQLESNATVNNVLSSISNWHDATTVNFIQSSQLERLTYLDILHEIPLSDKGTKLKIEGFYSISEPGFTLEALDLESSSTGFTVGLEHPFKRSRRSSLTGFAEFDWRDSESNVANTEISADSLRVLRTGVEWDTLDNLSGLTNGRLEVSYGLGILGASANDDPNRSRLRGRGSDFWKIKLDYARLQRLGKSWNFLLATTAQYSTDPLLAGEEFNFGGENFGRGYGTSEITGDNGIAAKAELHVNFPVGWQYLTHWQLFGFYDFGATYQRDRESNEDNEADTLASYGGGIRTQLTHNLAVDVTLAKPLQGVEEQGGADDTQLFIRVRSQF